MSSDPPYGPFADLVGLGGALCLDLANTVDWRATDRARDRLESHDDLLAWAEAVVVLPRRDLAALRACARKDPAKAARALQRTKLLREAIYAVFSAMARKGAATPADLDRLSRLTAPWLARTRFGGAAEAAVVWAGAADDSMRLPWAAAWSAADLLRGAQRERLRECLNPDCHWLFLDQSRNGSRRWCAMSNCGSREKNRRHYAMHRRGAAGRSR